MIKITIEGPAGSGKSTVAAAIQAAVQKYKEDQGFLGERVILLDDGGSDVTAAARKLLARAPSDVLIVVKSR